MVGAEDKGKVVWWVVWPSPRFRSSLWSSPRALLVLAALLYTFSALSIHNGGLGFYMPGSRRRTSRTRSTAMSTDRCLWKR